MIPALESDSHSLVSPLFLRSQTTTPVVQRPKENWAGKRSEGVRTGKKRGKKPSPLPLRFFLSRFPSASSY